MEETPKVKPSRLRRVVRWVMFSLVFLILMVVVLVGYFVFIWRPWHPFIDDGPFHGKSLSDCSGFESPSQKYEFEGTFQLETFDQTTDHPTVVLLRRKGGSIQWCIEADGWKRNDVQEIQFSDYERNQAGGWTVVGYTHWSYGYEATWWFLDSNGNLKEYWYSW